MNLNNTVLGYDVATDTSMFYSMYSNFILDNKPSTLHPLEAKRRRVAQQEELLKQQTSQRNLFKIKK
jgi:hypothetical protein